MKKNSILKKGAIFVLSAVMALGTCAVSFAAPSANVGTAATNKATLSVGKTLYNQYNGASAGKLSAQSFDFTIEAVEAKDGRDMSTIAVGSIPMPAATTVTIPFTTDDVKDQAKVTKGTSFAEITYTTPGYYLYKINEVILGTKVPGVTYDETSYFVCVYVVEDVDASGNTENGVYVKEITSWHNDKASEAAKPDLSEIAWTTDNGGTAASTVNATDESVTFGKVNYTKFVNQTASADFVVTKNVKGNLGDRNFAFAFTTALEGLNPGTTYTYTKTSQDASTADVTFTADAQGKATLNYTLKDDEQIIVKDVPIGTKYTTTEAANAQKASYAVTGTGTTPVIASASKANAAPQAALATAQETVDVADGTVTQAFTNTRDLATITGVPGMNYIVYGLAALMVVMGAAFILRRKHSYDAEM